MLLSPESSTVRKEASTCFFLALKVQLLYELSGCVSDMKLIFIIHYPMVSW